MTACSWWLLAVAAALLLAVPLHAYAQTNAQAKAREQVVDMFSSECRQLGPKSCAQLTVNMLNKTAAAGSGKGDCIISPQQLKAFSRLSKSPAAWEGFYQKIFDKDCYHNDACVTKAYKSVGSEPTGAGVGLIFFEVRRA